MIKTPSFSGQRTSWESLAQWYDGWVGPQGSEHHQKMGLPMLDRLLAKTKSGWVLDVGCGQGVLAPYFKKRGFSYLGIDASESLIELARKHHEHDGAFAVSDATKVNRVWLEKQHKFGMNVQLPPAFDLAVFMLSIQDMDPLKNVIEKISALLGPNSEIAIIMTHPAFRIPRQSGWEWDQERKLFYRRVDRYLTPLAVPLKAYSGKQRGVSLSFHRPLEMYINLMAEYGFSLSQMIEQPSHKTENTSSAEARAMNRAHQEIPLFLGLRFRRIEEEIKKNDTMIANEALRAEHY